MDKTTQNLRTLSEEARINPPGRAWDKLERKLDGDLKKAKRKKSRIISYLMNIAAAFLVIVSCIFIYQETQQDLTISKGNIAEWEELEEASDNHFNISRIHSLTRAYRS